MPQDFQDANTIHFYKEKGGKANCDNYLLCFSWKIVARDILTRLNTYLVETMFHKPECEFWFVWGTTYMIFTALQFQEKSQKENHGLYMMFIDLANTFDCVNHDGLWKCLFILGCPVKDISVIRSFHNGRMPERWKMARHQTPFWSPTAPHKVACWLSCAFHPFYSYAYGCIS